MNKAVGFIVIHRQMLDWEWHKNPNTLSLFIHLLLIANYEEGRFEGKVISRGQLVTSLQSLSDGTGLSFQQTRTALEHLILTGEITNKSYTKYRVITITNYDKYQDKQQTKQQTNNKQVTSKLTNNQQQYNNNNNIYNKETNIHSTGADDCESLFSKFWAEYPRKEAKQNAIKAWKKINPDSELSEKIMEGLKKWKESDDWSRDGGRYIPHPASWLNGRRWEDEVYEHKPDKKVLPFQDFQQRDYSGYQKDAMADITEQIREMKRKEKDGEENGAY